MAHFAKSNGAAGRIWRRIDEKVGGFLWVLLLPLLLIGVGVWERGRTAEL